MFRVCLIFRPTNGVADGPLLPTNGVADGPLLRHQVERSVPEGDGCQRVRDSLADVSCMGRGALARSPGLYHTSVHVPRHETRANGRRRRCVRDPFLWRLVRRLDGSCANMLQHRRLQHRRLPKARRKRTGARSHKSAAQNVHAAQNCAYRITVLLKGKRWFMMIKIGPPTDRSDLQRTSNSVLYYVAAAAAATAVPPAFARACAGNTGHRPTSGA